LTNRSANSGEIPSSLDHNRYFRYQLQLGTNSSDITPTIEDLRLEYFTTGGTSPLADAYSDQIVVSPDPRGAVRSYTITTSTPHTAGTGWSETVTGYDAYGSVVTGDSTTVIGMTNTGSAAFYTDATYATTVPTYHLSSGVATVYVKDLAAQTIKLTAADAAQQTITTGNIVVNPDTLASYALSTSTPQTAGFGWSETVRARDAYDNTITAASNAFGMTNSGSAQFFSDPAFSSATSTYALTSGIATIYVRDTLAETITLTVTDSTPKTGTTSNIVVNPNRVASYAITATSPENVGAGWPETVTAKDQYNNTLVNNSSLVISMSNSGNASFYSDSSYSTSNLTSTYQLSTGRVTIYLKDMVSQTITLSVNSGYGANFGDYWQTFGTSGTQTNNFSSPNSVFCDAANSKLYVVDTNNSRIIRIDSGNGGTNLGSNWEQFGSSGSGTNNFSIPRGISLDTANNKLYIADDGNNRLVRVDSGSGGTTLGVNWQAFSGSGGTYSFSSPCDVSVDTVNSKLFVADRTNNRIVVSTRAPAVPPSAPTGSPSVRQAPRRITLTILAASRSIP
jgi:hypothetical protein